MVGKDCISLLEKMECLGNMPIMEVENIKGRSIILPEPVYHGMTHGSAIFYNITSFRPNSVKMHTIEGKIAISTGKEMNFIPFCELLCKICRCVRKSAYPFGVQGLPTEECYLFSLHVYAP
jgi:hypothetical protein